MATYNPGSAATIGNDTISGVGAAETINGLAGTDTLLLTSNYNTPNNITGVEIIQVNVDTGLSVNWAGSFAAAGISLIGAAGSDSLTGSSQADYIDGKAGNDVIVAGQGNDFANGGDGNDTIGGGKGFDTLLGGAGADSLGGSQNDDVVRGGDGDDTLDETRDTGVINTVTSELSPAGNNLLAGGAGNDTVWGGFGSDQIQGGAGNDLLVGNGGNDVLYTGTGTDTVFGGLGSDSIYISGSNTATTLIYNSNERSVDGIDQIYGFSRGTDKIRLIDKLLGLDPYNNSGTPENLTITQTGIDAAAVTGDALQTLINSILSTEEVDGNDRLYTLPNGTTMVFKDIGVSLTGSDFVGFAGQSLAVTSQPVAEGNSGTTNMAFNLKFGSPSSITYTLNYETLTTGTATAGNDFVATTGTVVFAPGDQEKTVNITINGDTTVEPNETVKVRFFGPSLEDVIATGTITNDDVAASYTITPPTGVSSVEEGKALSLTINMIPTSTTDTVLTYNIAGDSKGGSLNAASSADFSNINGTVTIPAGQSTATLAITPSNDGIVEGLEGFTVSLYDSSLNRVGVSNTFAILDGASSGQTFTLTTNNEQLVGAAGNDVFYASIVGDLGNGTTLNPGDSMDGGAGNDSLNLTISGNPTLSFRVQSTAVETINLGNYDTDASTDSTLDLSATSGITDINVVGGNGDTLFTGIPTLVGLGGSGATGDISLEYGAGVLSGTADTQTVRLKNFGISTDSPVLEIKDAASSTNIAETVAITVSGSNYVTLDTDNNSKTLSIAGSGSIAVNANGETTITKVDASTATANVSILGIGTSDLTMTGGSGNDVLRIDGSTINTSDSIDAGTGTDTLQLTAATNVTSSTNGAKLVGFETVEGYANAAEASLIVAQDISLLGTAPTTVGVSSWTRSTTSNDGTDYTATDGVSFTNLAATTNMAISGVVVTELDSNDGLITNFTATGDLKTDTAADSITVTLGTSSAAMATLTTTNDTDTAFRLTLDLDDYETITLNSLGGSNKVTSITSGDLKTLNINATKSLTVSGATATNLRTINAVNSTAAVDISAITPGGASTITGGAGNDKLNGSSGNDSIVGNAGDDSIVGGGGKDTLDGGAGADTITGGSGNDVISGGDGNDTITLDSGEDSVNAGAGDDSIVVSFANLTSADTISGGDGTDSIAFDDTSSVALTSTNAAKFTNLTSIEKYSFTGLTGNDDTVSIDDTVVGLAGGSVTLSSSSNSATTWDLSGILSNSSSATVAFTSAVTSAQTVKVGNGVDTATLTSSNYDEAEVTNNSYLGASDSLNGGAGSLDTVIFTSLAGTTITNALSRIGGFERVEISAAADSNADYVLALSDTVLANNYNTSGGLFAVSRNDADADSGATTKVDASAVSSSYNVWIDGAAGNDTLIGGAGADTLVATTGADSISGGLGNDVFVLASGGVSGNVEDIITDLDLGAASTTSPTTVDSLNLSYTGITAATLVLDSAGSASGTVVVMDRTAYSTAELAEDALASSSAGASGSTLFFWQDTLGAVHLSYDTQGDTNGTATTTDIAKFSNLTIANVAARLDLGDLNFNALTLNGTSRADSLTGGVGNDTITGYAGSDTIIGGNGNDVISFTETTAASDTYVFQGVGTIASTTVNQDTISGFTAGSTEGDILRFGSTWLGVGFNSGAVAQIGSGGAVASGQDGNIVWISNATAGSNYDAASEISALLNANMSATSLEAIIIAGSDNAQVWFYDGGLDGAAAISSSDFVLIGVLNGTNSNSLVAGNFGAAIA